MTNPVDEMNGLTLSEIMDRWPETIPVFLEFDMLCVGCTIAVFHNIEDTCREHHHSESKFRQALLAVVHAT